MPIHEYKCLECGNEFEELVSGTLTERLPCSSCKTEKTERKISRIVAGGASGRSCGKSGFS